MTWEHMAPGDIIIHSDTDYVIHQYCTNTNSYWDCIEWIQVVPYESLKVQNKNNIESYSNTAVFVLVVMLLVWIVKWIFRLIFPRKWKI